MIATLILPGAILYLVYSLMGSIIGDSFGGDESKKYKVGANQAITVVQSALDSCGFDYELIDGLLEETATQQLKNGDIDIYIFCEESRQGLNGGEALASVEIYYDSTSTDSMMAYTTLYSVISLASAEIKPIFYVNAFKSSYDLATQEDMTAMMITMLFPLLMLIFLFSGSMAVSVESIAGEKERGTIATLLVTPVKRNCIAIGKVIALSITSLVSATASFLAVVLALPKLMTGAMSAEGVNFNLSMYGVSEILGLLLIIVFTVILFTVLLSIVSAIAKSIKEATAYATPIMILVIIIGLMGSFISGEKSVFLCLIPICNAVECMSAILSFTLKPIQIIFTVLSDTIFISLGIVVLAKLYSNEKVMFNK
jgi:sodium transport system permease protein